MFKTVICGPESTGKTELATGLARLKVGNGLVDFPGIEPQSAAVQEQARVGGLVLHQQRAILRRFRIVARDPETRVLQGRIGRPPGLLSSRGPRPRRSLFSRPGR